MKPRISMITLGVRGMAVSIRFYERRARAATHGIATIGCILQEPLNKSVQFAAQAGTA
jgi:hypothetical protein